MNKDSQLWELNEKCRACQEQKQRNFERIDYLYCINECKIGKAIHKLESGSPIDNMDRNAYFNKGPDDD